MSLAETTGVIGLAFLLALIATLILRGESKRVKNTMKIEGKLGNLKWVYTGRGQVTVFVLIFLVVVVCYTALRLTPIT
jgi:O-antigen ligase